MKKRYVLSGPEGARNKKSLGGKNNAAKKGSVYQWGVLARDQIALWGLLGESVPN